MPLTPDLSRLAVTLANNVATQLGDDPKANFRVVKKLWQSADVVVGVWQDAKEPNGVGFYLAKGEGRLQQIVDSGQSTGLKIAAIPCNSYEQAYVLKKHGIKRWLS